LTFLSLRTAPSHHPDPPSSPTRRSSDLHNNTIQFTKHYRTHQILDNGPLRTTFKLGFEPQTIEGQEISFSKTISIDAGQNFNKIDRKSTRLNSSHVKSSYAVFCLKKKTE